MASDEMAEVTSKPKPHPQDQTLARQPSIYSLTLDEIQNSLCEPGRNFGSMNMDDFLSSIFTTDDVSPTTVPSTPQPLHRQGSLTVPAPLSGKTVDEVWAHIHRSQGPPPPPFIRSVQPVAVAPPRQPTFGEMTLEDFLVKAGVVREAPTQAMLAYQVVPEATRYDFGYGGQGSGCNGLANVAGEEVEEDAAEVVDVKGEEVGKKRKGEAGERGVERRQRRMIKNRESAARSRARKQAYTVELEAELNILKEQNDRMKEDLIRAEEWRQQMIMEAMTEKSCAYAMNSNRNLRRLRTW